MTPEQTLWCEVLYKVVTDAVEGASVDAGSRDAATRSKQTEAARRYITHPNVDFNEVCTLAGLNPIAVREHVTRQIAKAPAPAELTGRNRYKSRPLTYDGQTLKIAEWSKITGLPLTTLRARVANGWDTTRALTTPKGHRGEPAPKPPRKVSHRGAKSLTFNGMTKTVTQWSDITGIKVFTLHFRLRSGWSIQDTLTTKPIPRGTPPKDTGSFTPQAQTPGVHLNLRPTPETGGGTAAQEINDLNFSQDCAA
jgi:hypothetical protein